MHLPETPLQPCGFRCKRRLPRMRMIRKREMTKNNAQPRTVISFEMVDRIRKRATGRTLEIAEFLDCDGCTRGSANVHRIGGDASRHQSAFRHCKKRGSLCAIEYRSARESYQCDYDNNNEGKITFHRKSQLSARSFSARVDSSNSEYSLT